MSREIQIHYLIEMFITDLVNVHSLVKLTNDIRKENGMPYLKVVIPKKKGGGK